jgi:hypothetical protein
MKITKIIAVLLLLPYICLLFFLDKSQVFNLSYEYQTLTTAFDKLNQIVLYWNFMSHYFPSYIQDLSGRPHLSCGLDIPTQRVGNYDTQVFWDLQTSYHLSAIYYVDIFFNVQT